MIGDELTVTQPAEGNSGKSGREETQHVSKHLTVPVDKCDACSEATSLADSESNEGNDSGEELTTPSFQNDTTFNYTSTVLLEYGHSAAVGVTPEQFAQEHNLMLRGGENGRNGTDEGGDSTRVTLAVTDTAKFERKPPAVTLFSVDLGQSVSDETFSQFVTCRPNALSAHFLL